MKKPKKFWNLLAKNYDEQVLRQYKDSYSKTVEHSLQYLKPSNVVLDYACGTGIITTQLSEKVKEIDAIDISDKMVNIAQQKAKAMSVKNIDFKVAELSDLEKIGAKYNVVLAYNILYFSKDIVKLLNQINNLLLPSGIFLSSTDCYGEKKSIKMLISIFFSKLGFLPFMKSYTTEELEQVIAENGFKVIETDNLYYGLPPNYFIAAEKIK